jgi:hypothetical protein
VTAPDAGRRTSTTLEAARLADIMVHNAGITRQLLANMDESRWASVDVNLGSGSG